MAALRQSRANNERQGLIMSFNELNEANETEHINYFFTVEEAFFGDSLFQFVADEVNAMLQILFLRGLCGQSFSVCRSFYNPFYLAMFIVLYLFTFPGALLHWVMFDMIPVRAREDPEERDLRSQGIYLALGLSIMSIPFDGAGVYLGSEIMEMINIVSLMVNCALILFNLIGLRALGSELYHTMRCYTVGIWVIFVTITGLALFDVFRYFNHDWLNMLVYTLRAFTVVVYLFIGINVIPFWNAYADEKSRAGVEDVLISIAALGLLAVVATGLAFAVFFISEENAWDVMFR